MKISIKPVDQNNWEEIVELEVEEDQTGFVASNAYSLAEAAYVKTSIPMGIFADDHAVGFVMYESLEYEGRIGEYRIYRLMIDKRHQNKGFGRKALKKIISAISAIPDCTRITISYVPGNSVAKSFYESFGFNEVGIENSGEMVAEIII